MTLLRAAGLEVSARLGTRTVPVLRDLDLAVEPGRILGLVGESGAGKSMIGKTIAQLLPPSFAVTAGSLAFDGRDLVSMKPARRRDLLGREIAFVPQEPLSALNPVLTVGRQIGDHLKRLGVRTATERRTRILEMFDAVRLHQGATLLGRYPHQLSGGMCQRVLIAMAFASRPRLVIADEPTTALDVTTQAHIVRLIASMQERYGTAVIFITHDLKLATQVCDTISVLYAGRIVEHGPARQVVGAPTHPYTRCLELANPNVSGPRRSLYSMPDRMPGLLAGFDMPGCRFAPRCPLAIEPCRATDPPLAETAPAQRAACIRPQDTPAIGVVPTDGAAPTRPGGVLVRVEGLGRRFLTRRAFGRAATFDALADVALTVREREFVGIVGESGSGKSTLARLIVGLDQPSSGRIWIDETEVTSSGRTARETRLSTVQMVFQDPQSALNPRRRVGSIVTQGLETRSPGPDLDERAASLLAEIGLGPEFARRFPNQLSGGQRQRINIARALAVRPRVLVADEIVSGLDVSVQAQILNLLLRLREEFGFALIFISHDLSVVRLLCERVVIMHRGRIVEEGPTERVFERPKEAYTRALFAATPPDDPYAAWSPLGEQAA